MPRLGKSRVVKFKFINPCCTVGVQIQNFVPTKFCFVLSSALLSACICNISATSLPTAHLEASTTDVVGKLIAIAGYKGNHGSLPALLRFNHSWICSPMVIRH